MYNALSTKQKWEINAAVLILVILLSNKQTNKTEYKCGRYEKWGGGEEMRKAKEIPKKNTQITTVPLMCTCITNAHVHTPTHEQSVTESVSQSVIAAFKMRCAVPLEIWTPSISKTPVLAFSVASSSSPIMTSNSSHYIKYVSEMLSSTSSASKQG